MSGYSGLTTLANSELDNLACDAAGNLYGTTSDGGADGLGTVAELVAGSQTPTTLVEFDGANGAQPEGKLVLDGAGNLYGTTIQGGDLALNNGMGDGTVFEIAAGTHVLTTLATFEGSNGGFPEGGLLLDGGNLYGTTAFGGADNDGTVFELAAGTHALSTLVTFDGSNGRQPNGSLAADPAGNLYGTTIGSGTNQYATVFEVAAGTHALSTLHEFDEYFGEDRINGGLISDGAGNLYGSAYLYGAAAYGTVFEVMAGTHAFSNLVVFNGISDNDNGSPTGGLALDAAGNLYGTTFNGGAANDGTLFEIPGGSDAGTPTTLVTFDGGNGQRPQSTLIADAAGNLYGTTSGGGANGTGTVFELTPNANVVAKLAFAQLPASSTVGATIAPVTVDAVQADGQLASSYHSNVTVAIASGPAGATLGGWLTVKAVNGVATFCNLCVTQPGTYTFEATHKSLTPAVAIGVALAAPVVPAKLAFIQQPVGVTAGTVLPPVKVCVEEASGNLAATYNGNVTVGIASGASGAALGGWLTVKAVNGVATFSNLCLTVAGTYTLKATHKVLTPTCCSQFTVTAAAAAKLAFLNQPANAAMESIGFPSVVVSVVVEDAFNNVCNSYESGVTLGMASGPARAVLAGDLTSQAYNGIAIFWELTFSEAGTYTLLASGPGLAPATSNRFTMS